jgi:hypothetical protein
VFPEGNYSSAPSLIRAWILTLDSGSVCPEFRESAFLRGAGRQPGNYHVVFGTALEVPRICTHCEWRPQICFGQTKAGRHHAHNREIFSTQCNFLPEYALVRTVALLPQTVSQQDHAASAGPIFFLCECAANCGLNSQQGKEAGRYGDPAYLLRVSAAGKNETPAERIPSCDLFKSPNLSLPVEKRRPGYMKAA